MQNRFLKLDTFFICFSYGSLKEGITEGADRFLIKLKLDREDQNQELQKCGPESFGTDKR